MAVQCKRYAEPVNGEAIQQVVAGAVMYHCKSTMVVTSSRFTVAAIELARRNNCRLIDKAALQEMDEQARIESVEGLSRAHIAAAQGNWERAERFAATAEDWGDSYVDLARLRCEEALGPKLVVFQSRRLAVAL